MSDLEQARLESIRASAGGFAFLLCNGIGWFVAGLLSFFLPLKTAALVLIFMGAVTLPASFLLQKAMGLWNIGKENPLQPLAVQLAMSQNAALPIIIVVYMLAPAWVPLAMACVVAAHFVPYAWLQKTNIYVGLAIALSVGGFATSIVTKDTRFLCTATFVGICLIVGAFLVKSAAARIVSESQRAAAQGAQGLS